MSALNDQVFDHRQSGKTAVLLVNLGTPDQPTAAALRRYLAEFLSDPRVVEIPRVLWWLILHGVILRIRPARSAKAYREIWTEAGSPLRAFSNKQLQALQAQFKHHPTLSRLDIALAMRYGKPSIRQGLQTLRQSGVRRLLVLPLYPQYSATTTASVFDAIAAELKTWRWLPELRMINHYHDFEPYIQAMAAHINRFWREHGKPETFILSFHGIPKRCLLKGDPYYCECQKTARLLAKALGLSDDQWLIVFQSRFGREEWLQPYLDASLRALPAQGCKQVDVFCPGFSADCLETLEEIAMQNKTVFLDAGGEQFRYIPALNDQPEHIQALAALIGLHTQGWLLEEDDQDSLQRRTDRARQKGATA